MYCLGAARAGTLLHNTASNAMLAPNDIICCSDPYTRGSRAFTAATVGALECQGPLHGSSSQCEGGLVSERTEPDTVTLQGSRGAVHDKDHLLQVLLQVLGLNGRSNQVSHKA